MTPIKAIRANCIECMCGNVAEVRRCPLTRCPLWPYRMGHRPKKDEGGIDTLPEEETEENASYGGS